MCSSFQLQREKKGSVIFEMDFKNSFGCGIYLSNDEIISVLCKHVMSRFVITSRSEDGYGF